MEFPDGSDLSKHKFPPGSELPHGSEQLDSKSVFLIRLILEISINLLVKRDREEKFYFSLCGFLEKGGNPENTFAKTTLSCDFG